MCILLVFFTYTFHDTRLWECQFTRFSSAGLRRPHLFQNRRYLVYNWRGRINKDTLNPHHTRCAYIYDWYIFRTLVKSKTFTHASRVPLSLGIKICIFLGRLCLGPSFFLSRVFSLLRVTLGLKVKLDVLPTLCILYGSEHTVTVFPYGRNWLKFFLSTRWSVFSARCVLNLLRNSR